MRNSNGIGWRCDQRKAASVPARRNDTGADWFRKPRATSRTYCCITSSPLRISTCLSWRRKLMPRSDEGGDIVDSDRVDAHFAQGDGCAFLDAVGGRRLDREFGISRPHAKAHRLFVRKGNGRCAGVDEDVDQSPVDAGGDGEVVGFLRFQHHSAVTDRTVDGVDLRLHRLRLLRDLMTPHCTTVGPASAATMISTSMKMNRCIAQNPPSSAPRLGTQSISGQ